MDYTVTRRIGNDNGQIESNLMLRTPPVRTGEGTRWELSRGLLGDGDADGRLTVERSGIGSVASTESARPTERCVCGS